MRIPGFGNNKKSGASTGPLADQTKKATAWHKEFTHGKYSATTKRVAIGTGVALLGLALYFKLKSQTAAKPLPPVKIKPPIGNPRRRLPQPPAPRA